jgi:hypothetical protein
MDQKKIERKPYSTPQLTVYGDIVALTHGQGKGGKGGKGGHGGALRS